MCMSGLFLENRQLLKIIHTSVMGIETFLGPCGKHRCLILETKHIRCLLFLK